MKIATWQCEGCQQLEERGRTNGRTDGRTDAFVFLQAIDYVLVDYTVMYTRTEIHARRIRTRGI